MDKDMMAWALAELERVYPSAESRERQAVMALLNVWGRMTLFVGENVKDLDRDDALDTFVQLARGQSLHVGDDAEIETPRTWVPASQYGNVSTIARVLPTYDATPDGWKLNGREGTITSIRRGDLIIAFTNRMSGAPDGFRAPLRYFEVDVSHLMKKDTA